MSDKYGHVRQLEADAAALAAAAHRQWWRFWLNHKRYTEALRLIGQAQREVDLIAARSREFHDAEAARRLRQNRTP